MSEYKRIVPRINDGELTVYALGACGIEDIMGTNEDLCTYHYSDPKVEYYYAYDYVVVKCEDFFLGYYIGFDRFCKLGDKWCKEYVVYEYAIFEEEEGERVNGLLFSHLKELAAVTGSSRIVFSCEGANSLMQGFLSDKRFVLEDNQLVLALDGVTLNEYDALVIPTCEDKLGYEELFFLREQCFELDREKCTLELNGEYLSVDRKTGVCDFSQNIRLVGAEKLTLDGLWSLTVLDVLCQMLKQGPLGSVKINLPSAREDKYTPDIQIDDKAVYIVEERFSSQERCELRTKLKIGGVIKKFMLYEFSFNFEIGGERIKLGFASV